MHAAVRAEFVDRVVAATKDRIRLGDPFDPATTMGPLNNQPTADKFARHVGTAVAAGARVLLRREHRGTVPDRAVRRAHGAGRGHAGHGDRPRGNVRPGGAGHRGELGRRGARADQRASPFGLTAAVFTGDLERGLAFAEQARAGWVNINASTNLWESHLPFGGRSGSVSGRGRVGGRFAMEAFTEPKTILYPAPHLGG